MKDKILKQNINGNIYIWKYLDNSRNYPGWNFTADKKACNSLLELLKLMQLCEWSSKKEIKTSEPKISQFKIPNNQNGEAKWQTSMKLILSFKKNEDENFWELIENLNEIEIQFGEKKITDFENALNKILDGNGDFAIVNETEDSILYFWWNSLEKETAYNTG